MEETFKNNFGKTLFIILVVAASAAGAVSYFCAKAHFASSCERIAQAHAQLCDSLASNPDAMAHAGCEQVRAMLELQHAEIQEDFSNLALWASALMVVFLVFSIYSMFKTDDLVKQSRESTQRVSNMAEEARGRINELDKLFADEANKLAEQNAQLIGEMKRNSTESIDSINERTKASIGEVESKIGEDIEKFKASVADEAQKAISQFNEMKESVNSLLKLLASPPDQSKK